jgi:Tfp pilus assembly protein FimV
VDAFISGNANRLRRGVLIALPTAASMQDALSTVAGPSTDAVVTTASSDAATERYIMAEGDTLNGTARRLLGTSVAQLPGVVQGLYQSNPHAFVDGDINLLQVGAVLKVDCSLRAAATGMIVSSPANKPIPIPSAASGAPTSPNAVPTPVTKALATASVPQAKALALVEHLADSARDLAAQRQVQGKLRERLTALTNAVQALQEHDARLKVQTEALLSKFESKPAAVASSAPTTRLTSAQSSDNTALNATTEPVVARPADIAAPLRLRLPLPLWPRQRLLLWRSDCGSRRRALASARVTAAGAAIGCDLDGGILACYASTMDWRRYLDLIAHRLCCYPSA